MNDQDWLAFLKWALPQLELRWEGFRKVRGQIRKRIKRRMVDLGLANLAAYRSRLEGDPGEWRLLDECCRVTISRFFRDQAVFDCLGRHVLPEIAARAGTQGRDVNVWSAGCASGEEPYTLKVLWDLELAYSLSDVAINCVATDIDARMLARAQSACYELSSLRELPPHLLEQAFIHSGTQYCLKTRHREGVSILKQDVRSEAPAAWFDLILCRNLAFTYFAPRLQSKILGRMLAQLAPDGYLVLGSHEHLPGEFSTLVALSEFPQILKKTTHSGAAIAKF